MQILHPGANCAHERKPFIFLYILIGDFDKWQAFSIMMFSYRSKIFYTEMVKLNRKNLCTQTLNFSRVMRNWLFEYAKTKAQIICEVNA